MQIHGLKGQLTKSGYGDLRAETADFAITGGTGDFEGAYGTMTQTRILNLDPKKDAGLIKKLGVTSYVKQHTCVHLPK